MTDRHIPLKGAMNFRDFGGYATREGRMVKRRRLFRSAALGRLTEADHDIVKAFRIRLICDLRRESERQHAPTRWCAEPSAENWHLPLFRDGERSSLAAWANIETPEQMREKMLEIYRELVSAPSVLQKYRTLFERLAQTESCPVLVHCSAGKDRTGVVCALILFALGVDKDTVMEDFLLTARYYDSEKAWARIASQVVDLDFAKGRSKETVMPAFSVQCAYLEAALDTIAERHGSVEAFFTRGVGLAPATLEEIRAHLLE